jgi:hypothetical protein
VKVVLEGYVSQIADLEPARKRPSSGTACGSCNKRLTKVQADYLTTGFGQMDSDPTRTARSIEDPLPLTQSECALYEGSFISANVIWQKPKSLVEVAKPTAHGHVSFMRLTSRLTGGTKT